MRKLELQELKSGDYVQSVKTGEVLEVVGMEAGKYMLSNGKVYTESTIKRWWNIAVVEPLVEEKEDTEEQDTTADTDTTTQDTEEQTNTSDLKDTDTQDDQLYEDAEQTTKTHTTEGNTATTNTGTIRQNNLITDINNLMDLHDVQMEAKKEYIKVSIPGKRGALCMIRPTRFGTGIHIDFKSKILAKLDENYRGMLIEQYNCSIYDKTRGYYRVFDCSDLEVLRTIILTAKQVG